MFGEKNFKKQNFYLRYFITKLIPYILRHTFKNGIINSLNAELNPICPLLALLGAHHILHVSRIRVKEQIF